jgi:hypothetical protein
MAELRHCTCPYCGAIIPIGTDLRPIKVRCPGCEKSFIIRD